MRTIGAYSAPSAEVTDLLGYPAGAGLVFPYFNLDGTRADYVRVKLDQVTDKRYRARKGSGQTRLYFPPLCDWARITRDPQMAIWITEGEKRGPRAARRDSRSWRSPAWVVEDPHQRPLAGAARPRPHRLDIPSRLHLLR